MALTQDLSKPLDMKTTDLKAEQSILMVSHPTN